MLLLLEKTFLELSLLVLRDVLLLLMGCDSLTEGLLSRFIGDSLSLFRIEAFVIHTFALGKGLVLGITNLLKISFLLIDECFLLDIHVSSRWLDILPI